MATTMTLKGKHNNSKTDHHETLLLTLDWVSTTGGASTTSTADFDYMFKPISHWIQGRELVMGQTNPSATAPTADYDIVVNDDQGQDLFGGGLGDRSATATESAFTYDGSVYGTRIVDGDLSIQITDAGSEKEGKLILTFE